MLKMFIFIAFLAVATAYHKVPLKEDLSRNVYGAFGGMPAAPTIIKPAYSSYPSYNPPIEKPIYTKNPGYSGDAPRIVKDRYPSYTAPVKPVYTPYVLQPIVKPVYTEPIVKPIIKPVYTQPIAKPVYFQPHVRTLYSGYFPDIENSIAEPVYDDDVPIEQPVYPNYVPIQKPGYSSYAPMDTPVFAKYGPRAVNSYVNTIYDGIDDGSDLNMYGDYEYGYGFDRFSGYKHY